MNGTLTSITLAPGATNPTVTANCTPNTVTYDWTVTRNGSLVNVSGLSGGSSTPDFSALSDGTYLVSLTATSPGWTAYQQGTPMEVIVQTPSAVNDVSCQPRLNGGQTAVTANSNYPTVQVLANCVPSGSSVTWTVKRGGTTVTIPGLTGPSSTPNFYTQGSGTYEITMTATYPGYNSFTLPSPLVVTVTPPTGTPVSSSHTISVSNNKLDILLIIDDSKSMLTDNQRLAARLTGFVNDLSAQGFDWQMCATLTRAQQIHTDSPWYWGASYKWVGNPNAVPWILKSGTANTVDIFTNTINKIGAGWAGTDDERAIKAAYWHLWNGEPGVTGTSGCYREDAGLAVLILSDEDERSIGGDLSQVYYESEKNKPMETDDLPQTYVNYVKSVFGNAKRFSVNSIIVRPGDTACLASQDAEGSKAHYGVHYAQLSNLTQGYAGSICDTDYSTNLNYFKDSIIRSQASIPLQCTPSGAVTAVANPNFAHSSSVQGNLLVFNPQIPAGTTVNLQYTCP